MAGSFLFLFLAALAILLLVVGLTTFLWLPLLVVGLFGLLWAPIAALLRPRGAGAPARQPSGVPTTAEASYDPVQDPAQR